MTNHTVTSICFGHFEFDRSFLTYMRNPGKRMVAPFLGYVVSGGDHQILVDTGPPDPEWCVEHQIPTERKPNERPDIALREQGFDPADIDIVVLSHLHWDHCGNNDLFPNAKFYVQRQELQYAAAPLPTDTKRYHGASTGLTPPWAGTPMEVIDGDLQLEQGVTILHTPGHSPGAQCLLVEGASQRIAIAQDTVPLYENWEGVKPYIQRLPNTIHVDLEDFFRSLQRLDDLADAILPGHDPKVLEHARCIS